MKAYEIKVTLKKSKPPIWRKIIIPADINFMQLHNIIQVAFEWLNYHLYEFNFKELQERITNNSEACEEYEYFTSKEGKERLKAFGGFLPDLQKTLYAKDVLIEKYFEKTKKFDYIYDFGDWWEHTVEVLKVFDDYEGACPVVTKFRQPSPPDDCGGIYGYYGFLAQYNDESDPEHEELHDWAEEQGYHEDYDLEDINSGIGEAMDFDSDDLM